MFNSRYFDGYKTNLYNTYTRGIYRILPFRWFVTCLYWAKLNIFNFKKSNSHIIFWFPLPWQNYCTERKQSGCYGVILRSTVNKSWCLCNKYLQFFLKFKLYCGHLWCYTKLIIYKSNNILKYTWFICVGGREIF